MALQVLISLQKCQDHRVMADFDSGMGAVIRAANFAAIKHKDQKRKDGKTPYINHPVGVANLIAELGKVTDPVILQAALLHDTVEDTATTFDELEKHFGTKVRNIVAEVTDDKSLPKLERKNAQVSWMRTHKPIVVMNVSSASVEGRLIT